MVEESALLDLKHLLMEAQQRVPPVLMALEDPAAEMDEVSLTVSINTVLVVSHSQQFRGRGSLVFRCLFGTGRKAHWQDISPI